MPIPLGLAIAAGAGQVGGGIYNIAAGSKQRREGERLFEQQLEDLRSGKYDLSVSQAERDVADLARQYGEQLYGDVERRGAATQQATLFGLRGGDPRLASTLPASVAAQDRSIYEAGQRAVGTGLAAQQRLAGMEQATLSQNQQFRRMLEQMQMQRGAAAGEAGRQMQTAGISQLASAPMDLAALNIAGGGFTKKDGTLIGGGSGDIKSFDVPDYAGQLRQQYGLGQTTPAVTTPATATPSFDISGLQSGIQTAAGLSAGVGPGNIGDYQFDPNQQASGGGMRNIFDIINWARRQPTRGGLPYSQQELGQFPELITGEDGMKAPMVTPGEFSHGTNPIDMVAEDGTKVGEVTGGELIFNPDQSGDFDVAFNIIKQLASQPNADPEIVKAYELLDFYEEDQFA